MVKNPKMSGNKVTLDDKYDLSKERIFVSGAQAVIRMLMMQRERDRLAGLDTAGFVSGYRGSPLGGLDQQSWKARQQLKSSNVVFQAGLNEDLADSLGIPHNKGEFVQAVEPGEAAAKAGIKAGDVVIRVDGKEVSNDQTLSYLVANVKPGSRIPIELIRNGKRLTVTATVGSRPSEEELARQSFDPDQEQGEDQFAGPEGSGLSEESLGLSFIPLTPQIARQLGAGQDATGLVVNAVDPNSDAARKGLRRGDIVMSANYENIANVADLETAIKKAKSSNREAVLLRVQRRGQPATYVPVRLR